MFLFWERERERQKGCKNEHMSGIGSEREWEREPHAGSTCQHRAWRRGLSLMNREIMTWAEIKNQRFSQLSYPGSPCLLFIYNVFVLVHMLGHIVCRAKICILIHIADLVYVLPFLLFFTVVLIVELLLIFLTVQWSFNWEHEG